MNDDGIPEVHRNDSKYRRYAAAVEKCLQSFESVSEWADVISFLSRLAKVFQSFPNVNIVPYKLQLAKRLAQCLNPALPAGVHQKTLELYEIIFRKIGVDGLAKDLSVYSFGLFPFFEHSATLVKSSLLELYEAYLIPLGINLRPSLRSLILSIIPGLEEESSEHFNKVNNLLNRIKAAVGLNQFYEALWTGLLISPRHRLAIVNYFVKNIPQNIQRPDLVDICINNPLLISRALAEALTDHHPLVVRGVLDIAIKFFPMQNDFLADAGIVDIAKAGFQVLMRKDMSLTRRFYTWIFQLGPNELETLSEYNKKILITALKELIHVSSSSLDEWIRPFKLLIFVLDKPLLAEPLIEECLFDLIFAVQTAKQRFPSETYEKILTSANLFFRLLDLDLIWGVICSQIKCQCSLEVLDSVAFAIENLLICDEASNMIHIHLASLTLYLSFLGNLSNVDGSSLELPRLSKFSNVGLALLGKGVSNAMMTSISGADKFPDSENALKRAKYLLNGLMGQPNTDATSDFPDLVCIVIGNLGLLLKHGPIIYGTGEKHMYCSNWLEFYRSYSEMVAIYLQILCSKGINFSNYGLADWFNAYLASLKAQRNMPVLKTLLETIAALEKYWGGCRSSVLSVVIFNTLPNCWTLFVESTDTFDTSSATLICIILKMFPLQSDVFFAEILSELIYKSSEAKISKFIHLWKFSRNLYSSDSVPFRLTVTLLTDALTRNELTNTETAKFWIREMADNPKILFDHSFAAIIRLFHVGFTDLTLSCAIDQKLIHFGTGLDVGQICFYFELIRKVITQEFELIAYYLCSASVNTELEALWHNALSCLQEVETLNFTADHELTHTEILFQMGLIALSAAQGKDSDSRLLSSILQLLSIILPALDTTKASLIQRSCRLCIDKMSRTSSMAGDSQYCHESALLDYLMSICSNQKLNALIEKRDVLILADLCRFALRRAEASNLGIWAKFLILLSSLPNSESDLLVQIMNDSIIKRLDAISQHVSSGYDPAISIIFPAISSILSRYFKYKGPSAASSLGVKAQINPIKSSFSLLLGDSFESSAAVPHEVDGSALSLVFVSLYNSHLWISKNITEFPERSPGYYTHFMKLLADCCRRLYELSPLFVAQHLLQLIQDDSRQDNRESGAFVSLFFADQTTEFIRNIAQLCRPSRDGAIKWLESSIQFVHVMSYIDLDNDGFIDLWNFILVTTKESSTVLFKLKHVAHYLVKAIMVFAPKINKADSSRMIKDADLIQRFIEAFLVLVSKLNDATQWNQRVISHSCVDSANFQQELIADVKDKHLGKCLLCMVDVLLPNISTVFGESDRITTCLGTVLLSVVVPNLRGPLRFSKLGQVVCKVIDICASFGPSSSGKLWRKDLWDAFYDNSFLFMPVFYFESLAEPFRLLGSEPERFTELLSRVSTSATSSMFSSKEAEAVNKAQMVRRLSMLTFWSNYDGLRMHLPLLQERLVDLIRVYHGLVLGEVFLLVRVMLLRLPDEALSSLWPLIMTELVQVFENHLKLDAPTPYDTCALFQACKLLDLMLTMRTSSILMYHWLFFVSDENQGLFHRLNSRLGDSSTVPPTGSNLSISCERRPLIATSSINNVADLMPFLQTAKSHLCLDYIVIQGLDHDFINHLTKLDLVEPFEIRQ